MLLPIHCLLISFLISLSYMLLCCRRKQDSLSQHNLFSLLGERLLLNDQSITMMTYNVLFEVGLTGVYVVSCYELPLLARPI